MAEEPYHSRVLNVVVSWIDRNLYKLATIALAVGFYLGMNEATKKGGVIIIIVSCLLGLLSVSGLILWIAELIRTPY